MNDTTRKRKRRCDGSSYRQSLVSFAVILFPSTAFWTSFTDCLAPYTRPTVPHGLYCQLEQQEPFEPRQRFSDQVCQWLDQQSSIFYRSVDFPSNIVDAYPTITNTGYTLLELERKEEHTSNTTNNTEKSGTKIALHLISTPKRLEECLPPKFQKDVTDYFNRVVVKEGDGFTKDDYSKVVHLHQDIWDSKREIVCHRLMAQLGLGVSSDDHGTGRIRRIFARKTVVRRIPAAVAIEFLDAHHLWGATKAKHNYGLFLVHGDDNDRMDDELVAVATFSARRKIVRSGTPHRSHELLRFCSRRDSNVVGGITKLTKAFCREKSPDDIVTVVDRDWGDGSGWNSLGFYTVATMDPIVMAVTPSSASRPVRRHLVGAGIQSPTSLVQTQTKDRIGLSTDLLEELDALDSVDEIRGRLSDHGFYLVYDTGVQRLMKVISPMAEEMDIADLWQNSQPTYAKDYYSPNRGITVLLEHASGTPSVLTKLLADTGIIECENK